MSQSSDIYVSVIIPAFNEQERIAESLYDLKDFLDSKPYKTEILVVDDGSHDLTAEVIRVVDTYCDELKSQSNCVLIENVKNVGKGYSIAKGMLMAKGQYVLFTDADLATPLVEIDKLLERLEAGFDMAIGTRRMAASEVENRSLLRQTSSQLFNLLVRCMGLATVSDSQCGFKGYRQSAAQSIAKKQKTFGFCFDVEQLHIASRSGLSVTEVPVVWHDQPGSTVVLIRDSMSMFADLIRIRWMHR